MDESEQNNPDAEMRHTVVMNEPNGDKSSEASSKKKLEKTRQLDAKGNHYVVSRLTGWLSQFYSSTGAGDTSVKSPEEKTKVPLDKLAEINAVPENVDGYEELGRNFRIEKEIARGGQGVINKAFDKHCARIVAVKSLHKELTLSQKSRQLFLTEAQITAQLEHPSIVPIYGIYGDKEDGLHIAMKMVHGKSLLEYLDYVGAYYRNNNRRVVRRYEVDNLKKRLGYFLNVLDAIAYVHHKRIVHRDLKPENIMIGAFGETYVMDWGISEKLHGIHSPQKPSGTVQYMAPEIINSQPYDTRADIYSLGLILFEIVFLKTAYQAQTMQEAIQIAKQGDISMPVHRFGCHVDKDLKYILNKALQMAPEDRYQTAEDFGKDVRAYLQGDVVSASPYQVAEKVFRYVRRNVKVFFGLLLLVFIGFLVSNAVILEQTIQENKDELKKKDIISKMTNASLRVAERFDSVITGYTNQVRSIALEVATRMENLDNMSMVTGDKTAFAMLGTTPSGLIYAPTYNWKDISFDEILYMTAPGAKPERLEERLIAMTPMKQSFFSLIMTSSESSGEGTRSTSRNLIQVTQNERPPLFAIFIGFQDGVHISYPFSNDFPQTFDPRQRQWYTYGKNMARGETAIAGPYIDKGQAHEVVLTLISPVIDAKGKFYGVTGADIHVNGCASLLKHYRNKEIVSVAQIVDRLRRVIVDSNDRETFAASTDEPTFKEFRDRDVFNRIVKMRTGVLFATASSGIEYIYVFKYINALDAFYIESINYSKLLRAENQSSELVEGMAQ